MLNHQPFNRGIKENHDNVLPQCSCSAADSGRGKTCRATEEGEPAWSPLTHLVKHPVTWSSYCSHNTICILDHPKIRVQTDCSNVLQPSHPPCATPTKTKGRRARGLLAGSVVGFPAQTCSLSSCSVLGEHFAQSAHDKSCVILDLFGHKRCQGFSNSNFIKWIVTGMNEFIDVWDLCNDK